MIPPSVPPPAIRLRNLDLEFRIYHADKNVKNMNIDEWIYFYSYNISEHSIFEIIFRIDTIMSTTTGINYVSRYYNYLKWFFPLYKK